MKNDMVTKETADIAPLGIDEPSPTLVWRTGYTLREEYRLLADTFTVFTSEDAAVAEGKRLIAMGLVDMYIHYSQPFRTALDDAIKCAKSCGQSVVILVDESRRVIEEYPL